MPESLRDTARAAIDATLRGDAGVQDLPLRTRAGVRLALEVELRPAAAVNEGPAGVIGIVTATRREPRRLPGSDPREHELELSLAEADFGTVLHDWDDEGEAALVGKRCFEMFSDRGEPCPHCPLRQPLAPDQSISATVFVREGASALVRAVRTSERTAQVRHHVLAEDEVSELLRGKMATLAERQRLSGREREVLDLLVLGRSLEEIGTVLGISARTAKFHQANLLAKLGVDSRLDLLRLLL